eukprot:gnl/Carplike_NY0171/5775_a7921_291.p1 GENE.gnl/Carplike_NY0171/5775_a7921_291~~gnl/Carplike_NY0171/5775_a7921_291.p1  ORF type:complete len:209 (+),score=39.48 gnl/Carplike_NY0171/5775_a7921_291:37-663(+)
MEQNRVSEATSSQTFSKGYCEGVKESCSTLGQVICCKTDTGAIFADRLMSNTVYSIWVLLMAIINLTLFIWAIVDEIQKITKDKEVVHSFLFEFLEVVVTASLGIETLLHSLSQGCATFWKDWLNVVDLFMFIFCTIVIITDWVIPDDSPIDNAISNALRLVRDILLLIRLVRYINQGRMTVLSTPDEEPFDILGSASMSPHQNPMSF